MLEAKTGAGVDGLNYYLFGCGGCNNLRVYGAGDMFRPVVLKAFLSCENCHNKCQHAYKETVTNETAKIYKSDWALAQSAFVRTSFADNSDVDSVENVLRLESLAARSGIPMSNLRAAMKEMFGVSMARLLSATDVKKYIQYFNKLGFA